MSRMVFLWGLLALWGCGAKDAPLPKTRGPVSTTQLLRCPVEGTKFTSGEGVMAKGPKGPVEVCSPGCRIRFELEDEKDK